MDDFEHYKMSEGNENMELEEDEEYVPHSLQMLQVRIEASIAKILSSVRPEQILDVLQKNLPPGSELKKRQIKKINSCIVKVQEKLEKVLKEDLEKSLKDDLQKTLTSSEKILGTVVSVDGDAWRPPGDAEEHMRSENAIHIMKENEQLVEIINKQEAELLALKQYVENRRMRMETISRNVDKLKLECELLQVHYKCLSQLMVENDFSI